MCIWSAKEVKRLAEDSLGKTNFCHVRSIMHNVNHDFIQIVDSCQEYETENKLGRLLDEMSSEPNNKVLDFTEIKRNSKRIMRKRGRHEIYLKH